jgi:hypothetical protein
MARLVTVVDIQNAVLSSKAENVRFDALSLRMLHVVNSQEVTISDNH